MALNQEDEIALTLGYIVQLSQESLVVPIQLIFSEHGKVSLVIERGRAVRHRHCALLKSAVNQCYDIFAVLGCLKCHTVCKSHTGQNCKCWSKS